MAVVEGTVANGGNAVGYGKAGEGVAIIKSIITNGFNTVWDGYFFNGVAIIKSIICNGSYTAWDNVFGAWSANDILQKCGFVLVKQNVINGSVIGVAGVYVKAC